MTRTLKYSWRGAMSLGAFLTWLLALGNSCSTAPYVSPDLALACTPTGPQACKPTDGMMPPPPDGMMPPPDGMMPPPDGMGPPPCNMDSDCTAVCPIGAKGCKCVAPPMGTGKFCTPTCTVTADCPKPPMGTITCDTLKGLCVVMP
jgi:hypothetical protein